jgi:glycosyltransferase involved in cell wall biosynthesis
VNASALIAVHWSKFQARTGALAVTLGGQSHFMGGGWLAKHPVLLPFRYLRDSVRTWRLFQQRNPRVVLAVTPPILVPFVAWLWCMTHGRVLLIDCHTGAFYSWKWRWAVPLLRWVTRRARAVLVHSEEGESLVKAWGAPALLVPDDVPDLRLASPQPAPSTPRVLVAGSFDEDEPVADALQAAAALPEVEFRFTGDVGRLPVSLRSGLPANVSLTGYLPYPRFLGEMAAAHVVAVFTTDPHLVNRAAFEAIGLARPLVCSEMPLLRSRFARAALFCRNDPAAMVQTLRQALREQDALAEKSGQARAQLIADREAALGLLISMGVNA